MKKRENMKEKGKMLKEKVKKKKRLNKNNKWRFFGDDFLWFEVNREKD